MGDECRETNMLTITLAVLKRPMFAVFKAEALTGAGDRGLGHDVLHAHCFFASSGCYRPFTTVWLVRKLNPACIANARHESLPDTHANMKHPREQQRRSAPTQRRHASGTRNSPSRLPSDGCRSCGRIESNLADLIDKVCSPVNAVVAHPFHTSLRVFPAPPTPQPHPHNTNTPTRRSTHTYSPYTMLSSRLSSAATAWGCRPLSSAIDAAARKASSGKFGRVCAVLGAQWGDEGKGKLADVLAKEYAAPCDALVWVCWVYLTRAVCVLTQLRPRRPFQRRHQRWTHRRRRRQEVCVPSAAVR